MTKCMFEFEMLFALGAVNVSWRCRKVLATMDVGTILWGGGAAFPWWRVIACHVTHRSSNSAEWMMICFYVIFPFLFTIFTNVLAMAWNIWYSDCQILASGSILLLKHLYNDRVSWSVCAMGAAVLVCAADAVQRIGSVGFTTSMFTTREFIHFSWNT